VPGVGRVRWRLELIRFALVKMLSSRGERVTHKVVSLYLPSWPTD
jgi:hypothetical protein